MSKLGPLLFCLVFALPFGAVGVGASYVLLATIVDGTKAKDWVLVKADVTRYKHPNVTYKYTFNDKQYTGDRMGSAVIGGSDNIDDWHGRMDDYISTAQQEKKPIQVFVNPDNPAQSMIDRDIRWGFLMFLVPFALGFGGVGVGALYAGYRVMRGERNTIAVSSSLRQPQGPLASTHVGERRTGQRIKSDAGASLVGLWIFTFFWNVISFPIAALFIPQMIEQKEWLGLLVLLFPLIGVVMLVAAIKSTFYFVQRGGVSMMLADDAPRVGGILQGHVAFSRGVKAGDMFKIRLVCFEGRRSGDDTSESPVWTKDIDSRATDVGGEARLQFRFDVPSSCKPTSTTGYPRYRWKVEARPPGKAADVPYGFQVTLDPPLMTDLSAAAAEDAEPAEPVHLAPEFAKVEEMLSGQGVSLNDAQKAQFNAMTEEQRKMVAKVAKVVEFGPQIRKIVIGLVVVFVAFQLFGFAAGIFALFK